MSSDVNSGKEVKVDLTEFEKDLTISLKNKFGKNIRIWVWPEYEGVKGFYGNGSINNAVVIWITERPSVARDRLKSHKFPDWIDKRFYALLKYEGLGNMHFTDFVKIMDIAGKQPTKEQLKLSSEWMQKEIETLRRQKRKLIIIANTRRLANWMDIYLPRHKYIYQRFFKWFYRFGKADLLRKELRLIYKMTL
jgi:hypothetical protein